MALPEAFPMKEPCMLVTHRTQHAVVIFCMGGIMTLVINTAARTAIEVVEEDAAVAVGIMVAAVVVAAEVEEGFETKTTEALSDSQLELNNMLRNRWYKTHGCR
jgi:hypothetical protein